MKHLKVFKNKEDYQLYKYSYLYKKPNISSIIDSYEILYDLFLFNSKIRQFSRIIKTFLKLAEKL